MSALTLVSPQPGLEAVSDLSADALDYGRAALSENTMRAYGGDWREFEEWCAARQRQHLPASPSTVANYASSLASAGKKVPTIARKLAAVRFFHRDAGEDNPTDSAGVAAILEGIRRTVGKAPHQKASATVDVIHALLAYVDARTLQGTRDRAILLLGFAGAFPRSELFSITAADLTFSESGVDVFLPKSKTDQEAKGQSVAVLNGKALKPADRLKEWIVATGIVYGPIFRRINRGDHLTGEALSAQSVALIVKKYADLAGLDVEKLSGHSLRAGFVTSAAENRASISRIMEVTRHRDPRTVETYVRRADRFKDDAGDRSL
ncbi:site-specific integrase [Rhizobium leguminosarum]|uniref:site-specific integrase n=1 Tax=Rhizobium leguminosarum TaxID=384 RepID=UPI003F9E809D